MKWLYKSKDTICPASRLPKFLSIRSKRFFDLFTVCNRGVHNSFLFNSIQFNSFDIFYNSIQFNWYCPAIVIQFNSFAYSIQFQFNSFIPCSHYTFVSIWMRDHPDIKVLWLFTLGCLSKQYHSAIKSLWLRL